MKRLAKNLVFSVFGLALTAASVTDVQACGGRRGGGYGGGFGGGHVYRAPVMIRPVQHVIAIPGAETFPGGPLPIQRQVHLPVTTQPPGMIGMPNGQLGNPAVPMQNMQPGQPMQQTLPQGQPMQPQQPAPMTGNAPVQNGDAGMTALQLLAQFGDDPAAVPTAPENPQAGFNGVGVWTASLPNSAVVQLNLQADGTFIWTALANGKQSTFQGRFQMNGQSLELVRENDQQRLAGRLAIQGNDSFTFTLNGAQDNGLTFTRS